MSNDLRRWIGLCEGLAQGSTLYHATDVVSAARILDQDRIKAATDHLRISKSGVSLTRSFRFAADWKRAGVIFALDGNALRARYRVIPLDYYHDRREHEEFVVGMIQALSRYLTDIFITPETEAYCEEHDAQLVEGHKDYEHLLRHPLLTIRDFPAPVPYYNPRKPEAGMFDAVAGG